jgi:voltage-gated potassium channel
MPNLADREQTQIKVEQKESLKRAKLRKQIAEVLDPSSSGSRLGRAISSCIILLILLNVIAVALGTIESFATNYARLLNSFELFSILVFSVEYVMRLWVCIENPSFASPILGRLRFALTPAAIIDFLAVAPFYIPFVFTFDLRFVRMFRLFRLLRIFKIGRYSQALRSVTTVFRTKKEELAVSFVAILILLIIASCLIYYAERDAQPTAFSSIPDSMWWTVLTLTNVGYGETHPITPLGKLMGAVVAIIGIGIFALPAGILASGFAEEAAKRKQIKTCPHCGKLIDINIHHVAHHSGSTES